MITSATSAVLIRCYAIAMAFESFCWPIRAGADGREANTFGASKASQISVAAFTYIADLMRHDLGDNQRHICRPNHMLCHCYDI